MRAGRARSSGGEPGRHDAMAAIGSRGWRGTGRCSVWESGDRRICLANGRGGAAAPRSGSILEYPGTAGRCGQGFALKSRLTPWLIRHASGDAGSPLAGPRFPLGKGGAGMGLRHRNIHSRHPHGREQTFQLLNDRSFKSPKPRKLQPRQPREGGRPCRHPQRGNAGRQARPRSSSSGGEGHRMTA